MRLVKIIQGTYGHRPNGSKSVHSISAGGTVELSDSEAKRLVALKVAAYVERPIIVAKDDTEDEPGAGTLPDGSEMPEGDDDGEGKGITALSGENDTEDDGDNAAELMGYSVDMSMDDLKELLSSCGLNYRVGMSKVDIVEMLKEYQDNNVDDDEAPPTLATEEPVT